MKKQHSYQKDLLYIAVSSFVLTAAWVGFNVFHTWVTTTITPELQVQITPIDPVFDTATISKLKTRRTIQPITTISVRETPEKNNPDDQIPSASQSADTSLRQTANRQPTRAVSPPGAL